jgi:hypothetical protein
MKVLTTGRFCYPNMLDKVANLFNLYEFKREKKDIL